MLTKNRLLFSLISASLSFIPLHADTALDVDAEDHVTVGSRELDSDAKELLRERRAKEHNKETTNDNEDTADCALEQVSYKLQNDFVFAPTRIEEPQFFAKPCTIFPVPCHYLLSIADDGLGLKMEDGSYWETSFSDAAILRSWRPNDWITITPNYSWFSSYDYYVTNKSTGSYVRANLTIGPYTFGANSNWVTSVDVGGHIYLQNGSVWCVHPRDQHLITSWAINDHIILGVDSSFWSYYDHILINVNMDEYVRVKQY